ncbi:hypothetical protein XENORESO_000586, partial [Xenotaenia resolanae]
TCTTPDLSDLLTCFWLTLLDMYIVRTDVQPTEHDGSTYTVISGACGHEFSRLFMKQKDTVTGGGRRHTERTNLQSVPAVRTRTERRFDTLTCLDPSGPTETKLDFLFLQQETANLSGSRRTGTAGDDGPESPMEEAQTAQPPQKERSHHLIDVELMWDLPLRKQPTSTVRLNNSHHPHTPTPKPPGSAYLCWDGPGFTSESPQVIMMNIRMFDGSQHCVTNKKSKLLFWLLKSTLCFSVSLHLIEDFVHFTSRVQEDVLSTRTPSKTSSGQIGSVSLITCWSQIYQLK